MHSMSAANKFFGKDHGKTFTPSSRLPESQLTASRASSLLDDLPINGTERLGINH
jgi:hypothetical protein